MNTVKRQARVKVADNLFKIGEVYYYRRGSIERRLGTFPSVSKAQEYQRTFETMRDHLGPSAFKHRVKDLWVKYEEERVEQSEVPRKGRRQLSPRTIINMQQLWEAHLRPFFGNKKLAQVDDVLWNDFTAKTKLNDLSQARSVFGHFCRWAKKKGYMRSRPELEIPVHDRRARRKLTEDQVRAIFSHAHGAILVFISLYLFMGVRRNEQVQIAWANVDFKARKLAIPASTSRTRKGREIPINSFVFNVLATWRHEQLGAGLKTPWVFPMRGKPTNHRTDSSLQGPWKTVLKHAKLDDIDVTPHDLRATFEHYAHLRPEFTDTQREKMAGASIEVQKRTYVNSFGANELRGLEEVVQIEGIGEILDAKKMYHGKTTGKRKSKKGKV